MAQYLDYEGLKLYDKNIKGVIAIKAVANVEKVTKTDFPENSVIQYIGPDDVKTVLKLTVTPSTYDDDTPFGQLTLFIDSEGKDWSEIDPMTHHQNIYATDADGNEYTIGYNGVNNGVKAGHIEGDIENGIPGFSTNTHDVKTELVEEGLKKDGFYKIYYNGDVPSFKYVELGADPGAIALAEDVESNVIAGAINPGDVIREGTNFTEFVKKLLTKEIPLTATLDLDQSAATIQIGDTATLTKATVGITKGSASTIEKAVLFIGDEEGIEMTKEGDNYVVNFDSNEYTEDTTFKAVVTYTKSDGSTIATAEAKAAYKFINPILTFKIPGVNAVTTQLNGLDLADLEDTPVTSELKEFSSYKFPVNVNAGVCGIGIPAGTQVSSIKDNSGFEYFDAFTKLTKTVTDKSGASVDYTFYVSPKATLTGTFAYTFK